METKDERKILRYQLCVKGLFGRNRKVKFETFTLVEECAPETPKTADELMPLFKAKLAEIKFKGGLAWISEDPITLTRYDMGERTYTTESFALCSSRTLHREKIEGCGVTFTNMGVGW